MKIIQEFKEFAVKGNVVDMAIGVIIGGAFGKVVTSFVADVIMPPVGVLLGGVNFADLVIIIKEASKNAAGVDVPAVVISYGKFIQTIVDFTIIAAVIFLVIKLMNSFRRKELEAPTTPPAPSNEEILLAEIRDLLKAQNNTTNK
jgi:large conductance mechanosensitive channel